MCVFDNYIGGTFLRRNMAPMCTRHNSSCKIFFFFYFFFFFFGKMIRLLARVEDDLRLFLLKRLRTMLSTDPRFPPMVSEAPVVQQ